MPGNIKIMSLSEKFTLEKYEGTVESLCPEQNVTCEGTV